MKTNLAYIDTSAAYQIECSERGEVTPSLKDTITTSPPRTIAGFVIENRLTLDGDLRAAKKQRTDRIVQYNRAATALRANLASVDVQPLAVLPRSAWDNICVQSGLFRISTNRYSTVNISSRIAEECRRSAPIWAWLLGPILGLAWAVTTITVGHLYVIDNWNVPAWPIVVLVVAGVGLATIWGSIINTLPQRLEKKATQTALKSYLDSHTHAEVLADLCSYKDHLSFEEGYHSDGPQIVLPTPPDDVAEVLLKVQSFDDLRVAAEAGAIQFKGGFERVLRTQYEKILHDEEMARRDPIVYVVHDGAVAIIAQFGDFPIEQEVVNRVVNSKHLI